MDTSDHFSMANLFSQLGLENDESSIQAFIAKHNLTQDQTISDASFWNEGQKAFIKEALEQDSDWTEIVEHLDAELR